jgi:hypothetical protein
MPFTSANERMISPTSSGKLIVVRIMMIVHHGINPALLIPGTVG